MASYAPPVVHATSDVFAVTDNNTLANDIIFLYQRPYANYFNSVATSLVNASSTQISLGGTTTSGYGFSISSNNIVVPLTGTYFIGFCAGIGTGGAGEFLAFVEHNGTEVIDGSTTLTNNSAFGRSAGSGVVACNAGDTLGLWGNQNSGSAMNTVNTAAATFLSVAFIGSQ